MKNLWNREPVAILAVIQCAIVLLTPWAASMP